MAWEAVNRLPSAVFAGAHPVELWGADQDAAAEQPRPQDRPPPDAPLQGLPDHPLLADLLRLVARGAAPDVLPQAAHPPDVDLPSLLPGRLAWGPLQAEHLRGEARIPLPVQVQPGEFHPVLVPLLPVAEDLPLRALLPPHLPVPVLPDGGAVLALRGELLVAEPMPPVVAPVPVPRPPHPRGQHSGCSQQGLEHSWAAA